MRARLIALAASVLLVGCSGAPPTPESPPTEARPAAAAPAAPEELPFASHVEPLASGVPVVVVDREHVLVDGAVVGDVHAIESGGKLQKVDGEFNALKAKREAWKEAHAGAPFPGVALLRMNRATKALVVKSVFQTAAFAGFPNLSFAVETAPGRVARIHADAVVPRPPPDPDALPVMGEKELTVHLAPGAAVRLAWKQSSVTLAKVEVPWAESFERRGEVSRAPALERRFAKEWKLQGTHQDPSDKKVDQAFVGGDDTMDLRDLIAVLDALYATTRDVGAGPVPAFNASFSLRTDAPVPADTPAAAGPEAPASGHVVRLGAPSVSGKLPSEVIQRVARQAIPTLRKCYEDALARDRNLMGKVQLRFVIDREGTAGLVALDGKTDIASPEVRQCAKDAFSALKYPVPETGIVTVLYPMMFAP